VKSVLAAGVLAILLSAASAAGNQPPALESGVSAPSCAFRGALCGYLARDGKIAIQPEFDWAESFGTTIARIKIAGKYGAIDRAGRTVIAPEWDFIAPPRDERSIVVRGGKYGLIDDITGKLLLKATFANLIPLGRDHFLADVSTPSGVAPTTVELEHLEQALLPVAPLQGRWGVIAPDGQWLVQPKIREIRLFADGDNEAFWVKPANKWQLLNSDGTALTAAIFDYVEPAVDGLAIIRTGNRASAMSASGKIITPPDAAAVRRRSDGLISYQRIDGIDVHIDQTGTVTVSTPTDGLTAKKSQSTLPKTVCDDGEAPFHRNGKWGFIDSKKALFIPTQYDAARCFERGIAWVAVPQQKRWCQIDKRGGILGDCLCRPPTTKEHRGNGSDLTERGQELCYRASLAEYSKRTPAEKRRR
jgi:hypothetical protein